MEITFDPAKNERNLRERSLGFAEAADFDFASADYEQEERKGEQRSVAVGYLRGRLHVLCFIPKHGGIRVISFRKANDPSHASMANRKPLTDEKGEVRELTDEDFARAVPFSGLPKELQDLLSQPKTIRPEADEEPAHHPAA